MTSPLLIAAALAATIAGAHVPDALDTSAGRLELVSCGVRDTLWVDHYVAGLYVPRGATAQAVRDARQPKAVRIQVLDARWMPANVPEKWRDALRKELEREPMAKVRAAYDRLDDGDVVTFTYVPQRGVRMAVNGRGVMQTPGQEVIQTILQAWAEGDPISGKLHRLRLEHPC